MSAMVVLAAMLRRCPYGPGRGLKKPRGRRAKAEVRRQARYIAHARAADCQSMTAREMLRAVREGEVVYATELPPTAFTAAP